MMSTSAADKRRAMRERRRSEIRARTLAIKRADDDQADEVFAREGRHFEASEGQVERSRQYLREHAAQLIADSLAQAMVAGWQPPAAEAAEVIVAGIVEYATKRAKLDYRSTSDKDARNNASVYVLRLHAYLTELRDELRAKHTPSEWDVLGDGVLEYTRRYVAEAHRWLQGENAEPEGLPWPARPSHWDDF